MRLPKNYFSDCYWAHMLTFRCNGGCPYCINRARGKIAHYEEMAGADIVKFWNSIEGHHGQRLSIIGGEPTLHKDFLEVVHGLDGYQTTLTSNLATSFFEDSNFCSELDSPSLRMNTTFHPTSGVSIDLFADRIRQMKGAGINVGQIGMVNSPGLDVDA